MVSSLCAISAWFDKANQAAESIMHRYVYSSRISPGFVFPYDSISVTEINKSNSDGLRKVMRSHGDTSYFQEKILGIKNLVIVRNYWWCAHFIDCAIDQALRTRSMADRKLVRNLIRSLYIRNGCSAVNDYYDDMAWFGLALLRAHSYLNLYFPTMITSIDKQLQQAWLPEYGGGVRWRKEDYFFNTPANGAAGIFALRRGNISQARNISGWLFQNLYDKQQKLMLDGVYFSTNDSGEIVPLSIEKTLYTYNQGIVAALEWGLARTAAGQDCEKEHIAERERITRVGAMIGAIDQTLCSSDHVIYGQGSGDGGLFAGILARYLTDIVCDAWNSSRKNSEIIYDEIIYNASRIVYQSARAAYDGALHKHDSHDSIVHFSEDWNQSATWAMSSDVSVQIGGWMVLEAAARIAYCTQGKLC